MEQKSAENEIDLCINLFTERLGQDFSEHLDLILQRMSEQNKSVVVFKEKQTISKIIKKISTSKTIISSQFKTFLKNNINTQLNTNTLEFIKLSWHSLSFSEDELSQEKKVTSDLKKAVKQHLGDELEKISKYTNYFIGGNHNVFSEHVITLSVVNTFKATFNNMFDFCFIMKQFIETWPQKLMPYYQEITMRLENLGIDKKIEEGNETSKDSLNKIKLLRNELVTANPLKPSEVLFADNGVDFDEFLRSLPPTPKIEKKDDSILSVSDCPPIDINDLPIIAPGVIFPNNIKENENITSVNNAKINSSSDVAEPVGNNNIGFLDKKEKNNELNKKSLINQSFKKDDELTETERELAKKTAINRISSDINKALLSQQRIEHIDFNSLIKKDLAILENEENESKILLLPKFLTSLNDIQKKFLKVTPEIFEKTKIYNKSIFLEILNNKLFHENINYYDKFVLKLLSKTYHLLYGSKDISIHQKLILFKTKIWVLQLALSDQNFWYYKDNPARVLFDFIINPELYNNQYLINQFDSVICNIEQPETINVHFFVKLINALKNETNTIFEKQQNLFVERIKPLEKKEWFIFAYTKLAEHVMTVTQQCEYQPIREFAEKIWAFKFAEKISKMISLTIFDLPDFTKVLPANMKTMLNQHFIVFDTLVKLGNNKDGSWDQMEKLKKFISKVNEGLGLIAYDLDIDPKLTKALSSFVRYKLDVISKTSNPISINEAMKKVIPNENAFKKEIESIVGENASYVCVNIEIGEKHYNLDDFFKLSHWYLINNDYLKLVHMTPRKDFYTFIDMQQNKICIFNKPKIWSLIKEQTIKDFTQECLSLNILNFLVQCNGELLKESTINEP